MPPSIFDWAMWRTPITATGRSTDSPAWPRLALGALMFLLPWMQLEGATTSGPAEETLLERAFALDEGVKVPRDAAGAAAIYRQAAESGDSFAHLRLGYLAETGDGVPQDYVAARAHYQAAVDAGLVDARLRLAICH